MHAMIISIEIIVLQMSVWNGFWSCDWYQIIISGCHISVDNACHENVVLHNEF